MAFAILQLTLNLEAAPVSQTDLNIASTTSRLWPLQHFRSKAGEQILRLCNRTTPWQAGCPCPPSTE